MPDRPARVASVVLNWKNRFDSERCLESLRALDYGRHQIIFVDNGSMDGSVAEIARQFPGVEIIENVENLGYAEGNNVGIRRAMEMGCDYIFVLNNDVVLDPGCLWSLVNDLDAHPGAAAVAPKSLLMHDPSRLYFAGGRIDDRGYTIHLGAGEPDNTTSGRAGETEWLTGCAILFSVSALRKVGLFDPAYFRLFEDADWSLRARRQGYGLRYNPAGVLRHKVSSTFDGLWSPTYCYYFARNNLLFIERNFPVRQRPRLFRYSIGRMRAHLRQNTDNPSVSRAVYTGWRDYLFRRFGRSA